MAKEGKTALTADEAKEKLTSAKEKLMAAKDAMKDFCKENKLKASEDHSNNEDAKVAKKWKKLNDEVVEKQARVEKYTAAVKEAKKSGGGIKAKYTYPKEVKTGEDKKKFRTETRAKAKKAGVSVDEYLKDPAKYADAIAKKSKKADKEEGKKKKKKTEEAAPAATAPAAEGEKKKKKKPAAEKTESED